MWSRQADRPGWGSPTGRRLLGWGSPAAISTAGDPQPGLGSTVGDPQPAWPRHIAVAVATVLAVALVWPLLRHVLENDGHRLIDLEVYRAAGRAVLAGEPIYDFRTAQELPFTYPPVAAWLIVPLTLLGATVAGVVWTGLNLALLGVLLRVTWRPAWRRLPPAVFPLALAGVAWVFPFRNTLVLGQVNLILMTLVLADCLPARTRWPRGLLVGVATAVKLTPGLFIPYLWLSGRRRAAYTAAATFGGLVLATWVALPGDSARYWLEEVRDPTRLGNNWYTANQSIRGMVLHLRWHGLVAVAVIGVLSAVALVLVLRRAPRLSRAGDELAALAVVGLGAALLSPVSWVHHMVWFLAALGVLFSDFSRRQWVFWGFALLALLAYKTPYWGAYLWHQHAGVAGFAGRLVQSCFTLAAFAVVAWLPARNRRGEGAERGQPGGRRSTGRIGSIGSAAPRRGPDQAAGTASTSRARA